MSNKFSLFLSLIFIPILLLLLYFNQKLQTKSILGTTTQITSPTPTQRPTPTPTQTPEQKRAALLDLTNEDRERYGLKPLVEDPRLDRSAQDKACDMIAKQYFSHKDPAGQMSWHLFNEEGYMYTYAGENLVEDYYEPYEMEAQWMNSPEHRENILGQQFVDVGFGFCGRYGVAHFGS